MSRKAIIVTVIVFVVIVIAVVAFLIYRNNKKKQALEAQRQMDILQQQLNMNPNMPTSQKGDILAQIAALAAAVAEARGAGQQQGGGVPSGPLPGLGGAGWPISGNAPTGFPLAKGSSSNYVKTLQMAINAKCGDKLKAIGMLPLTTDGKFGPLTEKGAAACLGSTNVSWPQFQGLTA